jgi:hypothetical protein
MPGKITDHGKSLTNGAPDKHQATAEEYKTAKEARLHMIMPQPPRTLEEEAWHLPHRKCRHILFDS